jgi:hypothetical protein
MCRRRTRIAADGITAVSSRATALSRASRHRRKPSGQLPDIDPGLWNEDGPLAELLTS